MRFLSVLVLASLAAGCTSGMAKQEISLAGDFAPAGAAPEGFVSTGKMMLRAPAVEALGGGDKLAEAASQNRRIVYTADLTVRVPNAATAGEQLVNAVREMGGFVANSSLERVVFRVPPARFEDALTEAQALGEVESRSINSDDVTDQFVDLELRVSVAEKSRARLEKLLENAQAVKDVLEVERDLRRLTEEIEQLKGALRQMNDRVDWATITVTFTAPDPIGAWRSMANPFPWIDQVGLHKMIGPAAPDAPMNTGGLKGLRYHLSGNGPSGLPEGFVRLSQNGREVLASTAERFRFRATVFETPDAAPLATWDKALDEELRRNRGYVPIVVVHPGGDWPHEAYRTEIDGLTWRYDVWVVGDKEKADDLLVIEYARVDKGEGDAYLETVEAAVAGAKLRCTLGQWLLP